MLINVITKGHQFNHQCREMIMQFYPKAKIVFNTSIEDADITLVSRINNDLCIAEFYDKTILINNETIKFQSIESKKLKNIIKISLYKLLSKIHNKSLPWGILTGIRPVKIPHKYISQGMSTNEITSKLVNEFLMTEENAKMIVNISQNDEKYIYPIKKNKCSIYIGIPFCPSKCVYCSFSSCTIKGNENLLRDYLVALKREISAVGNFIKNSNVIIDTLYIGGGTPTVLNSEDLKDLFEHIYRYLPLDNIKEFTLEAGRPDTISNEKLIISKDYGVSRISINPQTFNNSTLAKIGRNHSSQEIINAYEIARKNGFNNINMDVILGLVDEDVKDIKNSLSKIIELAPENITVHTLSIKKSSKLKENIQNLNFNKNTMINNMIDLTKEILLRNNYYPYYLYRQKYTLGNLENIGYCKPNKEGIYNILIMSEKQSIIGIGAGSTGKLFFPEEDRIERVETVKNIKEYISRIDCIIKNKINTYRKINNS